jgi:hypothetical protein
MADHAARMSMACVFWNITNLVIGEVRKYKLNL